MKKSITIFCFGLVSCITSKPVTNLLDQERQKGKEDTNTEFLVVKKDGTQITPTLMKFPIHGTSSVETNFMWVDGVKMRNNEILGYQTQSSYTAIARNSNWKDAKEMVRIRHGKINLYMIEIGGGGYSRDYYYYFDKSKADVQLITYELLSKAVNDNPQTITLLQTLFPSKKILIDMNGGVYDATKSTRVRLTHIFDDYNQ